MKFLALILTTLISLNSFADTGMEKNSTPKKEKYLYTPMNHMQTSVNLGLTYFKLDGEGDVDASAKPGLKLGVHAEFGQGLVYMLGINYLMLKSEVESTTPGGADLEVQLDYLSLNLGAKFYPAASNVGFYMRGNLDPSILINSSVDNGDGDFKDFDILAGLGLGFTLDGATNFNIDVGYSIGLLDISDTSAEVRNQGLTVTFGLLF